MLTFVMQKLERREDRSRKDLEACTGCTFELYNVAYIWARGHVIRIDLYYGSELFER